MAFAFLACADRCTSKNGFAKHRLGGVTSVGSRFLGRSARRRWLCLGRQGLALSLLHLFLLLLLLPLALLELVIGFGHGLGFWLVSLTLPSAQGRPFLLGRLKSGAALRRLIRRYPVKLSCPP